MIVVDASVAVKWFIDEEGHFDALQPTLRPAELKAPDIILAEVVHVLRRKVRMNIISNAQAADAIVSLKAAFPKLIPSVGLIDVAFDLSSTMDHSIYDAIYLACALDEPEDLLVTADKKFAAEAMAAGFGDKIRILGASPSGASLRQENENG